MWLIHTTALLLQNLRCVIHRQLGELKDIAVFEMKGFQSVTVEATDDLERFTLVFVAVIAALL